MMIFNTFQPINWPTWEVPLVCFRVCLFCPLLRSFSGLVESSLRSSLITNSNVPETLNNIIQSKESHFPFPLFPLFIFGSHFLNVYVSFKM